MSFSKQTKEFLGYYVYAYIDPQNGEIFYIGKGNDNRCFAHLGLDDQNSKVERISEIRHRGQQVEIILLTHGLKNESHALYVEMAIIEFLGLKNLTNEQRGHHSLKYGRMTVQNAERRYSDKLLASIDDENICFSKSTKEKLKHYVYVYVDPNFSKVFYVGKGKDDRCFSHLFNDAGVINPKYEYISNLNRRPIIELVAYGIADEELALLVEMTIIDLIGLKNLTNEISGHCPVGYGRISANQAEKIYGSPIADISEPSILFNLAQTYKPYMSDIELYEATRGVWNIDRTRARNIKYAMAVHKCLIREVYEIEKWQPACPISYKTRKFENRDVKNKSEFIGKLASDVMRDKYINSIVHFEQQNIVRYIGNGI